MWVIVCPPPTGPFDGIADYAARLARALNNHHETRLVVAGRDTLPEANQVDAVSLQYFPGTALSSVAPGGGRWIEAVRRRQRRVVVTVHEYWPPSDGTVGRWLRRRVARRRLEWVLRTADGIVVAQEISSRELRAAGVVGALPLTVVPVGSNIDVTAPMVERAGGLVVFGQPAAMDPSAMRAVAMWLRRQPEPVRLTWVAREAAEVEEWWRTRAQGDPGRLLVRAALPEAEVSVVLRGATAGLACHADGTSGRRTTLAALLVHGVPTIALSGKATDGWIAECAGLALVPADRPEAIPATIDAVCADSPRRTAMTTAALACGDRHVAWPVIADRYARLFEGSERGVAT